MVYYVDGNPIDIKTNRKCFDKGSEGKVYKIEDKMYKLYYQSWLTKMEKSLESRHKKLLEINSQQIVLPNDLIYDQQNHYAGYVTDFVRQTDRRNKGIIKMPSNHFIRNLNILQKDFQLLAENCILTRDVCFDNYIYDKENETMYVIDPGRFTTKYNLQKKDYKGKNQTHLDHLIEELLYLDFTGDNPIFFFIPNKRAQNIIKKINDEKGDKTYGEFFEQILPNYINVADYVAKEIIKKR